MALSELDGQLYLPLRVANLMSPSTPKCSWDAKQQTALCEGTHRLAVRAGSSVAEVDGASVTLSAPPRIEDGRLMISVRDVKPLFGLDYKWDPKLWAVRIFSPES